MEAYANKMTVDKSQSMTGPDIQKSVADNQTIHQYQQGPNHLTQRKLQELADKSAQVQRAAQLQATADMHVLQPLSASTYASGNGLTAQLATKITHTPGTVPFGGGKYIVGKKMEADLDPKFPVKGSATTSDNYDWMKGIRAFYKASGVVRGHLLNHDLGGYGVPENLYPISSQANSKHSDRVEQNVKAALSNSAKGTKKIIKYNVAVKENGPPKVPYESAEFDCKWTDENGKLHKDVIPSRLNIDKGWAGKSKNTAKSPAPWRHGKRRGQENMTTEIGKKNIVIDKSALKLSDSNYEKLRTQSVASKGISDIKDWEESMKMFLNELIELRSSSDADSPPKILTDGFEFYKTLTKEIDFAVKNKKLVELNKNRGNQMMGALIAIRKERIYLQDGIDVESNIAHERDDIDMTKKSVK